jgi:hypothetical protein
MVDLGRRRISRQDAKPQRRKQLALMNNFVSLFILYFAFPLRLCARLHRYAAQSEYRNG